MVQYLIKDGISLMDFDKATEMLQEVWWSPGIQKSEVMQGAEHSALVVGAFDEAGEQIGYARAISDCTRLAYIMDVVVDSRYRKQGIGRSMVSYILRHEKLKDVYQWLLLTKDAHGVYSKLGFAPVAEPQNWMEIRHGRPR